MKGFFDTLVKGYSTISDLRDSAKMGAATGHIINHDGNEEDSSKDVTTIIEGVASKFLPLGGLGFLQDIFGYFGIEVPSHLEAIRRTIMESWRRAKQGLGTFSKQNDSQPGIGPSVPGGNPGGGQGGGNPGNPGGNPGGSPDGGNPGGSPDGGNPGGNPGKQKPKPGAGGGGGSHLPWPHSKHDPNDSSKVDPIVLDFAGAEQEAPGASYFDYDGDGFAESTGWINAKQGLLVMDAGEDGRIETGKELLGDKIILTSGRTAADGFQALADLDDNHDSVIDARDKAWKSLKVWMDNGDGETQEGELKTLDELGIQSLDLHTEKSDKTDAAGNIITKIGSYTMSDGTKGSMSEYLFQTDREYTIPTEIAEVSEEIQEEIFLPHHGNMQDSWQYMMKDNDKKLQRLFAEYKTADTEEKRQDLLDRILFTVRCKMKLNS